MHDDLQILLLSREFTSDLRKGKGKGKGKGFGFMWGPWDWQMMPLGSTGAHEPTISKWFGSGGELCDNCHFLLGILGSGQLKSADPGDVPMCCSEVGRRAFWSQSPARAGYRGAGEGRGRGVEGACDLLNALSAKPLTFLWRKASAG